MEPVEVSIIVPTYKEADNSRDETEIKVKELENKNLPVRLIIRKDKRDLSQAVVHGFEHSKGEFLICMDADLSHPPEIIEKMLSKLETGKCEFVLASRYILDGVIDENWSWLRKLNSKGACLLARPFTKTSDPMSGFFALRKDVFKRAENLNPIGFKIALELIVRCRCEHIEEVPIDFHNRIRGKSKLNFDQQLKYLRHLCRLAKFKLTGR